MKNFDKYLQDFESKFVELGVKKQCLGKQEQVPLRNGRLYLSRFGRFMAVGFFPSEELIVIDYYGLLKKSHGFWKALRSSQKDMSGFGLQIKSYPAAVVHFASVRIEKVAALAPDLVADFPNFKKEILTARGFCHTYGK